KADHQHSGPVVAPAQQPGPVAEVRVSAAQMAVARREDQVPLHAEAELALVLKLTANLHRGLAEVLRRRGPGRLEPEVLRLRRVADHPIVEGPGTQPNEFAEFTSPHTPRHAEHEFAG